MPFIELEEQNLMDQSPHNQSPNGPQARHEAIAEKIDKALDSLQSSSKRLGSWAETELDPLLESVAKLAAQETDVIEQAGQKLLDELDQLQGELTSDEGALSGVTERVEDLIAQAKKALTSE